MKGYLSAWSLGTVAVVLVGILAMPSAARGQENRTTGGEETAPSVAPPPPPPPPPPPAPHPAAAPAPAPTTQTGSGSGRTLGGDSGRGQDRAVPRGADRIDRQRGSNNPDSNAQGRRRDGQPRTGDAVARPSQPQPRGNGGNVVVVPGYGGFGPWGFGYGGYYGGYYGAYDPWYGWYPTYAPSTVTFDDEGSLRLKVKPVEASVYVDGYYVGVVDDFDGIFQRLHIESGPHRIEIRAPGYETLTFDVRIEPDHTTTYRGELVRQP